MEREERRQRKQRNLKLQIYLSMNVSNKYSYRLDRNAKLSPVATFIARICLVLIVKLPSSMGKVVVVESMINVPKNK
jgi:hypothetical protein